MKQEIKFAWRNVVRNKKRSILTATSLFVAAVITAFAIGFINGMVDEVLSNYVNYQTGNLKVISQGYSRYERFYPVDEYFTPDGAFLSNISRLKGVAGVEERVRFGMLLGHGEESAQSIGIGAELLSPRLSISNNLLEGSMKSEGIYIGVDLAKKIGVKLGDELLLWAPKTADGGQNGIKARVNGIFRFGIGMFDRQFFFLSLPEAKKLLRLRGNTTELLVFTKRGASIDGLKQRILSSLPEGAVVKTPSEQVGSMYDLMAAAKYIYYLIAALIVFLASFVIVNTMMMAIFERIREIGTLKAMGMTDREIFWNFTLEGAMIGSLGGISGGIVGYILVLYFSVQGINMSAMEALDLPFKFQIYPSVSVMVLIITIFLAIVISALSAMWPARTAKKLTPAEALRKI